MRWLIPVVLLSTAASALGASWEPRPAEFVRISGPASPEVSLAVQRDGDSLRLALQVESPAGSTADESVSIGLAAAKTVVLTQRDAAKPATAAAADGTKRYLFTVPAASLIAGKADWSRLRIGVAVAWKGGPDGLDRQRERFLHVGGAPHAGLSTAPDDWLPFDLREHEALVADRKKQIVVDFAQPTDGKATIVIDDEQGRRVRNLIAGRPLAAGTHRIAWDGLDEAGNVVRPGGYTWRGISHPGIRPEYLFSFCNDGKPPWRTGSGTDMWGPDHSCLTAAAAGKDWTFMGGVCAESGYAIVAVDAQGTKRMHYNAPSGTGLWALALAADDKYLYAAHDGTAWGQHVDHSRSDWKATIQLTLTRYDIATGQVKPLADNRPFVVVGAMEIGPGSASPKWEGAALGGMTLRDGKLYISNKATGAIIELAADSGRKLREIPLKSPGALAAAKDRLYAVSGKQIVTIDSASQKTATTKTGVAAPMGLAVDAAGNLYVSDGETHTVKVFDAAGKPLRQIGTPGGPYAGKYDPQRMVHPRGLAVASNGWLWVTEERLNPKRAAAWNATTGKVLIEKFGPTAYGASGAGMDPQDHTRWIGQGAVWKLDFEKKTAVPQSILSAQGGHFGGHATPMNYAFVRQDGRTYLLGLGKIAVVAELLPDGSLRDRAAAAECHQFAYACDWNPPRAYIDAFYAAYPDKKGKDGKGDRAPYAQKGPGVLWVDRNGDGALQADEFSFSTDAEAFGGSGWGHASASLAIRYPAVVKGQTVLVALRPNGYYAGGAPQYPTLNQAIAKTLPIPLKPGYQQSNAETAEDRFGNVVFNSADPMTAFAPDGRLLWTYSNRWVGVHGSHDAPLPELGVMQGALFFLGMAPLDKAADVFVLNGNHGRFFAMTSDGLYLDEFFKDVRMGAAVDAYLIGGECFGGCFGRSAKDGNYYLQSGHTDYRIFRLDGLEQCRRSGGELTVTAAQAIAAANNQTRTAAAVAAPREAAIPRRAAPPKIDGNDNDWPREHEVRWTRSGKFPVSVRCAYDDENLYLCYQVEDASPWVNRGKDWTLLFKTGDSIDLQLGADAAADPKRREPVAGDLRLLIAPFEDKNIAVLYRHRLPGAKNPVTFTSPWRKETVDSVEMLKDARIAVSTAADRYTVETAIPLAALGLKRAGGKTLRADFGAIYGDPAGAINMLRSYWSNQATGLVNDVPGEIMLQPNLWGTVKFTED